MIVKRFILGMASTNSYVVTDSSTKECVIIDIAAYSSVMENYIKDNGYTLKGILLTHGHFDHIMGLDDMLKNHDVPVYIYEDEMDMLKDPSVNASTVFGLNYAFGGKVNGLRDGEVLSIAGMEFKVIHTPGHTKGGCCFYIENEKALFSGDTLFLRSVGRSDLPTGSGGELIRSLKDKLFMLPDDTKVYPGHMDTTTIGYEKKYNPFV